METILGTTAILASNFCFFGTFIYGNIRDLLISGLTIHSVSFSSYFLTQVGKRLMTDHCVPGTILGTLRKQR